MTSAASREATRALLRAVGLELPIPGDPGLRADAVIAVPSPGCALFRLVAANPPTANDFRAMSPVRAEASEAPEILRVGFSMYLTVEAAQEVKMRPSSLIARVLVPESRRIAIAKTGKDPAHVTVWSPVELVLPNAEVVNRGSTT
jgi:hypothetical protein